MVDKSKIPKNDFYCYDEHGKCPFWHQGTKEEGYPNPIPEGVEVPYEAMDASEHLGWTDDDGKFHNYNNGYCSYFKFGDWQTAIPTVAIDENGEPIPGTERVSNQGLLWDLIRIQDCEKEFGNRLLQDEEFRQKMFDDGIWK